MMIPKVDCFLRDFLGKLHVSFGGLDFFVSFNRYQCVLVGGVLHLYWERHGTSFRVQASMLLLVVGLEVAGP